jgi:Ca2+-binding RTX toxin-like protein
MTTVPATGTLVIPTTVPRAHDPQVKEKHMSRTRLITVIVGALLTLAFSASAFASGGGTPGDDNVTGGSRADHITLAGGDDHANGGRGDDVINGGRGDDTLRGGAGDDRLHGGTGDDVLSDDRGTDRLSGGPGNDRIDARDRRGRGADDRHDVVDCGTGDDTALVDSDDVVRNCEHVTRAGDDNGTDAPGTGGNGGADDPAGHS